MELDPGLVCYRHCHQGVLVATSLPSICQHCQTAIDIATVELLETPYRLPYPFKRASQSSCSIVIRPTRGDFLHDYKSGDNLHVGVTDSDGRVYEFDGDGLHSNDTLSFNQSLVVRILEDDHDPVWKEYWNTALTVTSSSRVWTQEMYNEDYFNCYTFIIEFLKELKPPTLDVNELNKISFCESFVLPKAVVAAKYISIYRQVLEKGSVALHLPSEQKKDSHSEKLLEFKKEQDPSIKEVSKKLDALVFSESSDSTATSIAQRSKKLPKRFVGNGCCLHTVNINTEWQEPAKEEKIENKVNEVINDIMNKRLKNKSAKYLTPYSDDIKKDLRSFVPHKSQCPVIPNTEVNYLQTNNNIESNEDWLLDSSSSKSSIEMCRSNGSYSPCSSESNSSDERCRDNPYKITIDIKNNKNTSNNLSTPHMTTLPSKTRYGPCMFFTNSLRNNKKSLSRTPNFRASRSENHCPEYDWFGGNTLRKKKQQRSATPSIWVRDLNKKDNFEDEIKKSMTYSEWVNRDKKIAETDSSSGSYQDIISITSTTNDTISFDGEQEVAEVTSHHEVQNKQPTTQTNDVKIEVPCVQTVSLKCQQKQVVGCCANLNDSLLKPYHVSLPVPSGIGNGFLVPQNFASEACFPPAPPMAIIKPGTVRQNNILPTLRGIPSKPVTVNPLYVEEPNGVTKAYNKSRINRGTLSKGSRVTKTKLRRAPTWRYGQEPCPENYEGKLLGKIDLSKKHDWEAKGQPSSLTMPGYIYDEGVLTETRC